MIDYEVGQEVIIVGNQSRFKENNAYHAIPLGERVTVLKIRCEDFTPHLVVKSKHYNRVLLYWDDVMPIGVTNKDLKYLLREEI